jgi:hypothetical protein
MRGFEVKTGEMPQARSSGPGISPVLVFFNPLTLFSHKKDWGWRLSAKETHSCQNPG